MLGLPNTVVFSPGITSHLSSLSLPNLTPQGLLKEVTLKCGSCYELLLSSRFWTLCLGAGWDGPWWLPALLFQVNQVLCLSVERIFQKVLISWEANLIWQEPLRWKGQCLSESWLLEMRSRTRTDVDWYSCSKNRLGSEPSGNPCIEEGLGTTCSWESDLVRILALPLTSCMTLDGTCWVSKKPISGPTSNQVGSQSPVLPPFSDW